VKTGGGHIGGRCRTTHRNRCHELLLILGRIRNSHEFLYQRGRPHYRVDAIDANLFRREFRGHGFAGHDDRALGAVVAGKPRARADRGGRKIVITALVVVHKIEPDAEFAADRIEYSQSLCHDLSADSIAWDDRDSMLHEAAGVPVSLINRRFNRCT